METTGKHLRDDDAESRREAARAMGSARTPAKSEAARARGDKFRGIPLAEETRRKLSEAQTARWDRIRAEKAVQGGDAVPAPKRPRGRPRKQTVQEGQEPNG